MFNSRSKNQFEDFLKKEDLVKFKKERETHLRDSKAMSIIYRSKRTD